jgi:hypothetical protein
MSVLNFTIVVLSFVFIDWKMGTKIASSPYASRHKSQKEESCSYKTLSLYQFNVMFHLTNIDIPSFCCKYRVNTKELYTFFCAHSVDIRGYLLMIFVCQ